MKFPYSMLRDFVQTDLNADQIGDLLTMAGFELEGIEKTGDDAVLDIKVMSNRGDGLSVFGLAREVLAKDQNSRATELYERTRHGSPEAPEGSYSIEPHAASIEAPECRRFAVREFKGVDASQPAPEWIRERLELSGVRPISVVVDITNYVMLELGQPLHAFDRDKLAESRIVVRHARPGEKLTTLNGIEHDLAGQMMICDAEKPVGVPGVMGGLETEVTDNTRTILLESANFQNTNVRRTRKQLGLNTEASYRFERSVDPEGVVRATRRFTELLVQCQPGITFSNIVDLYPHPPQPSSIALRLDRAQRLLGMQIERSDALRYLRNLGFEVTESADPNKVDIASPSWRPDIVREIDLIEELGRVHGYERIPEELPIGHTPQGGVKGPLLKIDLIRDALVRAGFIQIISHSLRDQHVLDSPGGRVGPKNPASPEMAWLRNSLLPCLADAAVRNEGRDLQLFEVGVVFGQSVTGYKESKQVAMLVTGGGSTPTWNRKESASPDFFSLKSALEGSFASAGFPFEFKPVSQADSRLHPTRAADVLFAGRPVGILGQLHPEVCRTLNLPPDSVVAEIDLTSMLEAEDVDIAYRPISRNPAVRRDLSFEIAKSIPFQSVEKALTSACGELLERMWLFDVYTGKGIAEGNHSLSVALQLRKQGANFTDEEANQVREKAVAALAELGAKSR